MNPTRSYLIGSKTVTITRVQTGTAYARNGNTHNPTRYYTFNVEIDGGYFGNWPLLTTAWETAAGHILSDSNTRFRLNRNSRRWDQLRPTSAIQNDMKATSRPQPQTIDARHT